MNPDWQSSDEWAYDEMNRQHLEPWGSEEFVTVGWVDEEGSTWFLTQRPNDGMTLQVHGLDESKDF